MGAGAAASWAPWPRPPAWLVGVIPQALVDKELANHQCDELHIVTTMHRAQGHDGRAQRRLPGAARRHRHAGGAVRVWTWRQLGYHDKPIGLLDVDGYYAHMLRFLEQAVANGFMGEWQMGLVRTGTEVDALLSSLVQDAGLNAQADPRCAA